VWLVKATERWWSERLQHDIGLARWGHFGQPVLVFPTAGGDAEEIERNGLVAACAPLLDSGRVKLYSCDSVAGRAMVSGIGTAAYRMWLLNQFHACVRHEVVPAIEADLGGQSPRLIATGASIGAFNALAVLCRYPDQFDKAIGMSGTYAVQRFYDGQVSDDLYFSSPVHFLPGLEGPQLDLLRERFAVLAAGQGAWEDVGESWRAAEILGAKGIPNRVDAWGQEWPHDWQTWRQMLPQYLDEMC
jgi:esterase/lipase superfamily enzyme